MESFNLNRHLKEQFVSNLTGSSKLEIFFLITNLSILIIVRHGISWMNSASAKKDDNAAGSGKSMKAYFGSLLVDFLCLAVPYILFVTPMTGSSRMDLSEHIRGTFAADFPDNIERNRSSFLQEDDLEAVRANISSYRVSMMLLTCFSILAVDFKIFPRRYAKTEAYGTSLVRTNVLNFDGSWGRFICSGQFLGFTAGAWHLEYVHVGEYGVHWNFFFTLAAVAILTSIINVRPKILWNSWFLYPHWDELCVISGYQALLLSGLNKYLLSEERGTDIFSQNKEGISSIFGEDLSIASQWELVLKVNAINSGLLFQSHIQLIQLLFVTFFLPSGYWGMYLLGVRIGSYLFFADKPGSAQKPRNGQGLEWALCLLFWSITLLVDWQV
ncbi:UNVERIFIED_CONTAM: hypothetical protein Sangu_0144900 [Sesamum angustifolium]|uniref:Uncharacterized protein n=1 Tax=Sesamum angustifolium TaxID=2727405 RepID=A0AAW2RMU9_9LAMI